MRCETCNGNGGWWVDWRLNRATDVHLNCDAAWLLCHDCIGGVSSCCDSAGSAQPEPARSGGG